MNDDYSWLDDIKLIDEVEQVPDFPEDAIRKGEIKNKEDVNPNEKTESLFTSTLNSIKKSKENAENGIKNSIPFGIPFLDRNTPGISKGLIYSITAGTGQGKTKFTKFLFVSQAYKFIKNNPGTLKYKLFYFALEESKEEFMLGLISERIYDLYNIEVDYLTLKSLGNKTLPLDIIEKIEKEIAYFEDLENVIEIIDFVSNPFGIYKTVKDFFLSNGTTFYKKVKDKNPSKEDLITHEELNNLRNKRLIEGKEYEFHSYEPNDPNLIVAGIYDHIGLLVPESKPDSNTLHSAIDKLVTEYVTMNLCKKFGLCAAFVHQQEVYGDKQQFDNSGVTVINKLLPSINKLGDNKLVGRSYKIVLGIFSPHNYKIENYLGYNINILKNNFRSIVIIKNRYGNVGVEHPMFFNGACNKFISLAGPNDNSTQAIYQKLSKR